MILECSTIIIIIIFAIFTKKNIDELIIKVIILLLSFYLYRKIGKNAASDIESEWNEKRIIIMILSVCQQMKQKKVRKKIASYTCTHLYKNNTQQGSESNEGRKTKKKCRTERKKQFSSTFTFPF